MSRISSFVCVLGILLWFSKLSFGQVRPERVKIPLCNGYEFTSFSAPNIRNDTSQDTAIFHLYEFAPLIETFCHRNIVLFLCLLHIPAYIQEPDAPAEPRPPCKSLCQNVTTSCQYAIDKLNFFWPDEMSCQKFNNTKCFAETDDSKYERSPPSPPGCSNVAYHGGTPICSSVLSANPDTKYFSNVNDPFSNYFNHTRQEQAITELSQHGRLIHLLISQQPDTDTINTVTQCLNNIRFLLCNLYLPRCGVTNPEQYPFTKSQCKNIIESNCSSAILQLRNRGYRITWPPVDVNCDEFSDIRSAQNHRNAQGLTCPCTGSTCVQGMRRCDDGQYCFMAEIIQRNGSRRIEKGCKDRGQCQNELFCPTRAFGDVCGKFGCCDYDRCEANATFGVDLKTELMSTLKPLYSIPPMISSLPEPNATLPVVPIATKASVVMTTSPGRNAHMLNCPCTGSTCVQGVTLCDDGQYCFMAEIIARDGRRRIVKGCKDRNQCQNELFCPLRAFDDMCGKFGCCDYDRCEANATFGADLKSARSSTLIAFSSTSLVKSSSPEPKTTSTVVPISTKAPVVTTTSPDRNAQGFTCPCTGSTCVQRMRRCYDGEYCFMAEIIQRNGSRRIEEGCKDKDQCRSELFCPLRAPGDVCGKFGCCDYDRCEANATFGVDLKIEVSSSPKPFSSKLPMTSALLTYSFVKIPQFFTELTSSLPESNATLLVVPIATKVPVVTTTSPDRNAQGLTCPCTGSICVQGMRRCDDGQYCFMAEIIQRDGCRRIEKGCKDKDQCRSELFCQLRANGDVCGKFGCCDYDRCEANATFGVDLKSAPSSSPIAFLSKSPMKSSSPEPKATSTVVPISTKAPVVTTTSPDRNAQGFTCPCTGSTCVQGMRRCDDGQYCFMAEIIQGDGSRRIEKGCKDRHLCQDEVFCPLRAPGDVCGKFGCCDYDRCEANATFGVDLKTEQTSSLMPRSSIPPMISSLPEPNATLPVVPIATKASVVMTTSPGRNAQMLNCPCTGSTCVQGLTLCDDGQYCFMAEIIARDGSRRIVKGCKDKDQCRSELFCPLRAPGDVCGKFGCCDYDRCEANATFGVDLKPALSSSPIVFSSKSLMKSSSPEPKITSTVVPISSKAPVVTTTSPDRNAKGLTCPCTGSTCVQRMRQCYDGEYCFMAEIIQRNGSRRIEKGCKDKDQCRSELFCPLRAPGDMCGKFGCCDYDRCEANATLGVDLISATASSPKPFSSKPFMTSSPPEPNATLPVLRLATKGPIVTTTSPVVFKRDRTFEVLSAPPPALDIHNIGENFLQFKWNKLPEEFKRGLTVQTAVLYREIGSRVVYNYRLYTTETSATLNGLKVNTTYEFLLGSVNNVSKYPGTFSKIEVATTRGVEQITSSFCSSLYPFTKLPNLFGHKTQNESFIAMDTFAPLLRTRCSSDMKALTCSAFLPSYLVKERVSQLPCRSLCQSVFEKCAYAINELNFKWPEQLKCDHLPQEQPCYPASPAPKSIGQCPNDTTGEDVAQGRFTWPAVSGGIVYQTSCPYGKNEITSPLSDGPYRLCACNNDDVCKKPYWDEPRVEQCNFLKINDSEVTSTLSKVLQMLTGDDISVHNASEQLANITGINASEFDVNDVVLSTLILEDIVSDVDKLTKTGPKLVKTVNNLLKSDPQVVTDSQRKSNASARLITVLESYLKNIPLNLGQNVSQNEPNIAVYAKEISSQNFNGAGVASIKETTDSLLVYDDNREVQSNVSQVSLAMPSSLFENLDADDKSQNQRILFVIYRSTSLFTSLNENVSKFRPGTVRKKNSFVISGSVKDQRLEGLKDPIVTTFKPLEKGIDETTACVFWNFTLLSDGSGDWSPIGCSYKGIENGVVTCHCTHLTNFAILMDVYIDERNEDHEKALSIISYVGCAISLVGLILTIVTILILKDFRSKVPTQILLNFCIALSLTLIVFLVGAERSKTSSLAGCRAAAIALHYFVLAMFIWTTVQAYNMYLAFVKVMPTYHAKFILKCCSVGWGAPAVVVIISAAAAIDEYGGEHFCRVRGLPFQVGFLAPVISILLCNSIAFGFIIRSLLTSGSRVSADKRTTGLQHARRGTAILVVLGLTWMFGILAIRDAKLVFQYLFCIFNSLQGLLVFIFYCVLSSETKAKYRKLLFGKSKKRAAGKLESSSEGRFHEVNYTKSKSDVYTTTTRGSSSVSLPQHQTSKL